MSEKLASRRNFQRGRSCCIVSFSELLDFNHWNLVKTGSARFQTFERSASNLMVQNKIKLSVRKQLGSAEFKSGPAPCGDVPSISSTRISSSNFSSGQTLVTLQTNFRSSVSTVFTKQLDALLTK